MQRARQRFCLFDTWLSSVVVGRSVATVAEISFSAQWAMMLHYLAETADVETASRIAWLIVPMIVVAQCCSWLGVITTNYLANAIENAIWAIAFFLVGVGLYGSRLPARDDEQILPPSDRIIHRHAVSVTQL